VTEFGAPAAFFGAVSAHGMMWRMLLADAGTELAHLHTECAEANGKGRSPSHPLCGQQAYVGAIPAQPDAPRHEFLCLLVLRHLHADHIVATGVADARAIQARLNAIESMLIH